MNNRNKYLTGASVLFGAIVAILAVTGSSALVLFAVIGGIALGLMWVLSSRMAPSRERIR